jgi:hypothetical protein
MRACLLGAIVASAMAGAGAADQNLVSNPGFEGGPDGWSLPAIYAVDDTVAHSGSRSLRYQNAPGGPYVLAAQVLPLKPGKCYRFGVWVKTRDIASGDTGATICMEWWGRDGYIGGAYPLGVAGTADWRRIEYISSPIPAEATGGHVVVYGRPGTAGTAWFDDVEVVELARAPVRFGIVGAAAGERQKTLVAGTPEESMSLEAELAPDGGLTPEDVVFAATLRHAGASRRVAAEGWQGRVSRIVLRAADLAPGETQAEVGLERKADGAMLTSEFYSLQRRAILRVDVVEPNSAGVLGLAGALEPALRARVTLAPLAPGRRRDYAATLTVLRHGRPRGEAIEARVSDAAPAFVTVPTARLSPGLYDLRCEVRQSGPLPILATDSTAFTVTDPTARPANATCLGPNRVLMVDGKPLIPIGFYILSSLETVLPADKPWRWSEGQLHPEYYLPILDRLAESNLNCLIDYGSTMGGLEAAAGVLDAAHQRGLHVIFSVKDLMKGAFWEAYTRNLPWKNLGEAVRNVVAHFREHPALMGWYINDEVIQPDVWQGAVDVFRAVREVDPWHPTYAVHYDFQGLDVYSKACDVVGTDPYALTGDIGFTARSWRAARGLISPDMPFWAVVQCFGAGYETSNPSDTREPTYDEERAATMAAIAEGATGIIYYCFHSLQRSPRFDERLAELNRIAGEVKALTPIIALPAAARPAVVEKGNLSALTKQGDGRLYLILASTERADQDVLLRLPFRPRSVRDMQSGEALKADGDRLVLRFGALDAWVLEVSRR